MAARGRFLHAFGFLDRGGGQEQTKVRKSGSRWRGGHTANRVAELQLHLATDAGLQDGGGYAENQSFEENHRNVTASFGLLTVHFYHTALLARGQAISGCTKRAV